MLRSGVSCLGHKFVEVSQIFIWPPFGYLPTINLYIILSRPLVEKCQRQKFWPI